MTHAKACRRWLTAGFFACLLATPVYAEMLAISGGGWNDFARHLRSAYRATTMPGNRAYTRLAPQAKVTEGLSVHYAGDSSLESDMDKWLKKNGLV